MAERETEQRRASEAFARDFRRAYLLVSAGLFLVLLALLGFGLYRWVVRPVRTLREATQAVARGDLHVQIAARANGGDEVTALARDFSSMVSQLRGSQAALAELNQNLEREVERKTEHLEGDAASDEGKGGADPGEEGAFVGQREPVVGLVAD